MFDMKVEYWTRSILAHHEGPQVWPGRGQAVRCGATFIRDMIPQLEVSRSLSAQDRWKVAKLACLAEVLGFADYSVEIMVRSEMIPS